MGFLEICFTHLSVLFMEHYKANIIAPDVTPQKAASHHGQFCLLTGIVPKYEI